MRTFLLAILSVFVGVSRAFLPNQFSAITVNDYTHTDITELGILAAVSKFFEDNPVSTCKNGCAAGSLTGIADINARKLYEAYYGGLYSEKRFQEAIDDIVKRNNEVDQNHYTEAEWHFNGEKIREGNSKMQLLSETAIQILNGTNPSYGAAREVIGQYLHLLQMFYSNTNWAEQHGNTIYNELGIPGQPIMATAPPTFDTCKSCGIVGRSALHTNCLSNLIVTGNLLTSGYKSGQNVVKPTKDPGIATTGKCSHGGPRDTSSSTQAALGGINKDSMDPTYSPHAHLHEIAAQAAIEHTRFFFGDPKFGLRAIVGDDVFQDVMQLRAGNSLVFVIDTTGSMGRDVEAIKNKTAEIVSETRGTARAPYNYILVEFNDPGNEHLSHNLNAVYQENMFTPLGNTTTIQTTTDPKDIQMWLGAIVVHGGGTCGRFSLTGLQAAATVAMVNSQVFVFTDSPPKDPGMVNYITSLSTEKKLQVQFLLSGTCRKRSNTGTRTTFYRVRF